MKCQNFCELVTLLKKMLSVLLTLTIYITFVASQTCRGPTLETPLGEIFGYHKLSHEGKKFSAFEGIPYALPPVDNNRFELAEAVKPWDTILNASTTHTCAQYLLNNRSDPTAGVTISGEEDCLYLNVYVPRAQPSPKDNLDVIVHIHGGAFMMGCGHCYPKPEYLMDKEAILVTVNYRLGAFGFLSTEDDVVPGNNGLKDQVLALKWIQTNIASFGGNNASVTLTGTSAGGASVHLHYFSPMSKGLFHRGSSQSGCALNPWVIQKEPLERARKLAGLLDCPSRNSKSMIKCIKDKNYYEILNKTVQLHEYLYTPWALFGPVVERGAKPFLSEEPYTLLEKGKVHDLPWIASTVTNEGYHFSAALVNNNTENANKHWKEMAPFGLFYNEVMKKECWQKIFNKINDFYSAKTKNNALETMVNMANDRLFFVDISEAAKLQASVTKSSVYYYIFSYERNANSKGVQHGEDMIYLFYMHPTTLSESNLKMKDLMVDMWIEYAKTGKPAIKGVTWKPTKSDKLTYLDISSVVTKDIKMKCVEEMGNAKFWKSMGLINGR